MHTGGFGRLGIGGEVLTYRRWRITMIWHYTHDEGYHGIRRDGFIRPANLYVPVGEKPIVWFSTEEVWEPTVTKGVEGTDLVLKMADLVARNIRLYRIGVDSAVAPFRWSELKLLSGMSSQTGRLLAARAKELGANPSRWRGTFDAVTSEKWEAIEYFNGVDWVTLEEPSKLTHAQPRLPETSSRY
jgi:hypothetical protein